MENNHYIYSQLLNGKKFDTCILEKGFKDVYSEVQEHNSSLKCASVMQQGVLPQQKHFDRLFKDSFILFKPQSYVSGDFYWIAQKEKYKYIAVGDCTGHGVSAAMMTMLGISLINIIVLNSKVTDTHDIIKKLDKKIINTFPFSNDRFNNDWIDISIVRVDEEDKQIQYTTANRKMLYISNKKLELLQTCKSPVGAWQMFEERTFTSDTITYKPGDKLYMGSDGFQDQFGGENNKKLGSRKLHNKISDISHMQMKHQKNALTNMFDTWKNDNFQVDDVCIVGIEL